MSWAREAMRWPDRCAPAALPRRCAVRDSARWTKCKTPREGQGMKQAPVSPGRSARACLLQNDPAGATARNQCELGRGGVDCTNSDENTTATTVSPVSPLRPRSPIGNPPRLAPANLSAPIDSVKHEFDGLDVPSAGATAGRAGSSQALCQSRAAAAL